MSDDTACRSTTTSGSSGDDKALIGRKALLSGYSFNEYEVNTWIYIILYYTWISIIFHLLFSVIFCSAITYKRTCSVKWIFNQIFLKAWSYLKITLSRPAFSCLIIYAEHWTNTTPRLTKCTISWEQGAEPQSWSVSYSACSEKCLLHLESLLLYYRWDLGHTLVWLLSFSAQDDHWGYYLPNRQDWRSRRDHQFISEIQVQGQSAVVYGRPISDYFGTKIKCILSSKFLSIIFTKFLPVIMINLSTLLTTHCEEINFTVWSSSGFPTLNLSVASACNCLAAELIELFDKHFLESKL